MTELKPIVVWLDGTLGYGSLDEQKAVQCNAIDTLRDELIEGGFVFAGHRYQSRQSDRENIMGLAMAASAAIAQGAQPGDINWLGGPFVYITADNELVPMDAHTVMGLYSAGLSFKSALTFAARANKDAILACRALVELADLDLVWPEAE